MTSTPAMKGAPKIIHNDKDMAQKELKQFMEEECRPVRGIFKNYECPGGSTKIVQSKYPGKPIFEKVMQDGEEYEVPLWVARALNGVDVTAKALNGKVGLCSYPVHSYTVDRTTGQPVQGIGQRKQRYGFQSLDFVAG